MKKYLNKFNILIFIFFLINLLSSIFTPIGKDEAYYWFYSQNLAWGYFDHPPMIAILIKFGILFLGGEIGVRLMTVLLMTSSVFFIWLLIPKEYRKEENSVYLFFLLIFANPVFNIYGFITTPDVPLIFFGTLYLLTFKKLVENTNIRNTILLGICAGLLIYSKYHGGILIIISIISKPELLKKYNIYLAGVIAFIMIIPHVIWQFNNDFVTFNYHLNQRTDGSFKILNVGNYLLGSIGILNPVLFFLIAILTLKKKIKKSADKFVPYTFWGFLIFFLLYSFRGKIEAQWVAISAIPLTIMLHNSILGSEKIFKYFQFVAIAFFALFLIARIAIILPLDLKTEFHENRKDYYEAIYKAADEKRVAFVNSYQNASKYSFYTGDLGLSLNYLPYRKNQYDIVDYEKYYNNQQVFLVGNWHSAWMDTLVLENKDTVLYNIVDKLPMIAKMKVKFQEEKNIEIKNNVENKIKLNFKNPYTYDLNFNQQDFEFIVYLSLKNSENDYVLQLNHNHTLDTLKANSEQVSEMFFTPVIPEGKYKTIIFVRSGYLYSCVVSKVYNVTVKN